MGMNLRVDPTNITNFNQSEEELQLVILFWLLAAGKNALTSAKNLEKLLTKWFYQTPFETIKRIPNLAEEMKAFGIGCYNNKAKSFRAIVDSGLDLKTCTVEDLENIYGIGSKTARCVIMHSRPNQKYAGLDTHILAYMRDQGYNVPKSTPSGKKYREIEALFLKHAEELGRDAAELDLSIWNQYRKKNRNVA